MTQIRKNLTDRRPASPRLAARCRGAIDQQLDHDLFRALADPTRLRLLACLAKCGRPCSVTEVADCCDVDFSVVSRHLAMLARAGVLDSRKSGRTVSYGVRYQQLVHFFRAVADAVEECCPDSACDAACCAGPCAPAASRGSPPRHRA